MSEALVLILMNACKFIFFPTFWYNIISPNGFQWYSCKDGYEGSNCDECIKSDSCGMYQCMHAAQSV